MTKNADLIYLDNSATTRVDPEVATAMSRFFTDIYGNPSSIHALGAVAHKELVKAKGQIATLLNCSPEELIVMGTGTECSNFAIIETARLMRPKGKHIITSVVEHKATLNTTKYLESEGFEVTYLPVNERCELSISDVEKAIRPDTILISLMYANNEVGSLFPIKEIAQMAKKKGILMHTDAVQAVGKIDIDVQDLGVDMLTMSGHKIYAPKGIGVLYIKAALRGQVSPLIHGGGQEDGLRSGTENMPYIVGLAKAAEIISKNIDTETVQIKILRDLFEKRILSEIPYTKVNGAVGNRVCSLSNIVFQYIESEALIGYVPEVCFSLGSACNASEDAASHVLTAMNVPAIDIRGAARFSFGRFNTVAEVHRAVDLIVAAVEKLRKMSPIYPGNM